MKEKFKLLKKIAIEIIKIEKTISNKSPEEVSKAEQKIMQIINQYNLNLIDMMTIDELVQRMLEQ